MAEFKIDGRMTVRKLKENFKNEFGGTLRVYDGRELADDKATLAAIRKGDAKGGELVCRASRTVAKFKEEMLEVFGIKVQVSSPDDVVLALDGITLANLKNIKKNATKADMEGLVAYKRKNIEDNNKVEVAGNYGPLPIFDFNFKKVDWELNADNIEKRRKSLEIYGVIFVRALTEDGDFSVKVISNCDIADGLYDAMDEVECLMDEGVYEEIEVYYTTVCEVYGADKPYQHGDDFGYVLSSFLGAENNDFDYNIDGAVICRVVWNKRTDVDVWVTDDWGNYETGVDLDVDVLIENK